MTTRADIDIARGGDIAGGDIARGVTVDIARARVFVGDRVPVLRGRGAAP